MTLIRALAVAGQFYSGSGRELGATSAALPDGAQDRDTPAPGALIVPHAGHTCLRPVAAGAHARLRPQRDQCRCVILMGPCQRTPVHGLALSGTDVYRTPMGDVPRDNTAGVFT